MVLFVAFLLKFLLVPLIRADYRCICNYEVETQVYKDPNTNSDVIAYLYEFDCKPAAGVHPKGFFSVQTSHMLGYVDATQQISAQTCAGDAPIEDLLTTTPSPMTTTQTSKTSTLKTTHTTTKPITTVVTTNSPTTKSTIVTTKLTTTTKPTTTPTPATTKTTTKPTTASTVKITSPSTTPSTTTATTTTTSPSTTPSTTPTTTKTTTTTTTATTTTTTVKLTIISTTTTPTVQTTKPPKIPEGHIELCPNVSKNDVNRNGGFLGQYGLYCYEYVPYHTQWKNAERHCNLVSKGNLMAINDQGEQDFALRFLKEHKHTDPVWIGLSDSNKEGKYEWTSGANVTFKNFKEISQHYTDYEHTLNDCVVLQSDGQWVDIPCGVPIILGGGFGEAHAYICQYDLTSKPPDVFTGGYLSQLIIG